MNNLDRFNNKKIALLGLGVENFYLIKYLFSKKVKCEVLVIDNRSEAELGDRFTELKKTQSIQLKKKSQLADFDIIFRSPGFPLFVDEIKQAKKAGVEISSPMKLFFELCPSKNIIGVTGTKGKGTTSSLIYEIIKESKRKVYFGGNIGVAPFSFLNKIRSGDWIVLELSSFQLEDKDRSPKIAVVTNFYKEHLAPADPNNPNYHKNLPAYWRAKSNVFLNQKNADFLVVNSKLRTKVKKEKISSQIRYFEKSELATSLPGEHNKENIAAAVEVARILRIKKSVVSAAIKKFKGLEHRIELVAKKDGVEYYDDSFATTPDATITALKSFSSPIIVLLGGADKGSNFKQLARDVKKRVKFVVLLKGKATPKIKQSLLDVGFESSKMKQAGNIEDAVKFARDKTESGDIVLLSTACASFGMFKNYKERGDLFAKELRK